MSFLSSHLATLRRASLARSAARAPPARPSSGSGSGRGGGAGLAPEVRQWEVQWEDITVVRPIGQGSFGRVRWGHELSAADLTDGHGLPCLAPPSGPQS